MLKMILAKNPIIGKDLLKIRYSINLIETYKIEMY